MNLKLNKLMNLRKVVLSIYSKEISVEEMFIIEKTTHFFYLDGAVT